MGLTIPQQPKINLETVKSLVVLHGPRPTARLLGLSHNTVLSWCHRYNWRKSKDLSAKPDDRSKLTSLPSLKPTTIKKHSRKSPERSINPAIASQLTPSLILQNELETNRDASTLYLGRYLARSSEKLSVDSTLKNSRRAVDLANVHKVLYPPVGERSTILSLSVLTNQVAIRRE